MKITLTAEPAAQELFFCGVFEDEKITDKDLAADLTVLKKQKRFLGAFGEVCLASTHFAHEHVFFVGLGKEKELTLHRVRQLLGKIVKKVKCMKVSSFSTDVVEQVRKKELTTDLSLGRTVAETLHLASYTFAKYLAKGRQPTVLEHAEFVWEAEQKEFAFGLKQGEIIAQATNFSRDLINEPANVATPLYLEKVARKLATHKKVRLHVLKRADMERLKMGALLGVAKGSALPPRLLVLEYIGSKKQRPIAFVGKGITFDSGGYNLKPTGYMEDMKVDMSGAAAVLGIIKAAAQLNVPQSLVGVVPTCENMVSGMAQRPGDIVTASNGKTIEIGNTDAEGRLILADALVYTEKKFKPSLIVDFATLTGACVVALGHQTAGMMGMRSDEALEKMHLAGEASGDRVWQLPFYEEYHKLMDGSISDLKNISPNREAGAITAGVFLSKFVEKAPWVHIDIAGPASLEKSTAYLAKGGSGAGVRLAAYYLLG